MPVYFDKQKVEIGKIEPIPDGYQIEHEPMLRLVGPKMEKVEIEVKPQPQLQIRRR